MATAFIKLSIWLPAEATTSAAMSLMDGDVFFSFFLLVFVLLFGLLADSSLAGSGNVTCSSATGSVEPEELRAIDS